MKEAMLQKPQHIKEQRVMNPHTKLYETEFGLLPFKLPLDDITEEMVIAAIFKESYELYGAGFDIDEYSDITEENYSVVEEMNLIRSREKNIFLWAAYLQEAFFKYEPRTHKYFTKKLMDKITKYIEEDPSYKVSYADLLPYLKKGLWLMEDYGPTLRVLMNYRKQFWDLTAAGMTLDEIRCAALRDILMFRLRTGIDLQPDDVLEKMIMAQELSDKRFIENHVDEEGHYYEHEE